MPRRMAELEVLKAAYLLRGGEAVAALPGELPSGNEGGDGGGGREGGDGSCGLVLLSHA